MVSASEQYEIVQEFEVVVVMREKRSARFNRIHQVCCVFLASDPCVGRDHNVMTCRG